MIPLDSTTFALGRFARRGGGQPRHGALAEPARDRQRQDQVVVIAAAPAVVAGVRHADPEVEHFVGQGLGQRQIGRDPEPPGLKQHLQVRDEVALRNAPSYRSAIHGKMKRLATILTVRTRTAAATH